MKKPNFFIVGAKKSGTTAMFEYLKQHPDVYMSDPKEPAYFGKDLNIPDVVMSEAEYMKLFAGARNEKIIGEGSTWYLCSQKAAHDIHDFNPASKILIMLRNPVDMIHSLHSYLIWLGWESIEDFEEALEAEGERRQGRRIPYPMYPVKPLLYREMVNYSEQVQNYLDVFGREPIKFIIFDDFKKDALGAFRQTCEFLGIDASFEPHIEKINENRSVRNPQLHGILTRPNPKIKHMVRGLMPQKLRASLGEKLISMNSQTSSRAIMPPELRDQLTKEFTPDVERLSQLVERDLVALWFGKQTTARAQAPQTATSQTNTPQNAA